MHCIIVPGPLADVAVLGRNDTIVIVWRPPQNPNGELLGYSIRFYELGMVDQANNVDKEASEYYHVLTDADVPSGSNIQVQVC